MFARQQCVGCKQVQGGTSCGAGRHSTMESGILEEIYIFDLQQFVVATDHCT